MLKIPESKRDLFKKPIGSPITEDGLKKLDSKHMLITVGDVVSLTVRNLGILQDLAIYDGFTERREMTGFADLVRNERSHETVVINEAGSISDELVTAVKNAMGGHGQILRVEGEEDLATLPCILYSPDGTNIIYGWPGVGMMVVTTDEIIRKEIQLLMQNMEESE